MNSRFKRLRILAVAMVLALLVFTGSYADLNRKLPRWTVLIYINGNSEPLLQRYNEASLEAMEAQKVDPDLQVIVQIARGDDHARARRYLLKGGKKKLLGRLGKTNMGDYRVLEDFVRWGMGEYPAKHTALVVKGHGVGHLGLMKDMISRDRIYLDELEALVSRIRKKTGRKIDVFGFDSCHMANAETAYALRDSVCYMVASSEISYAPNWEYGNIIAQMKSDLAGGGPTPRQVAMIMAENTRNNWFTTISIIDCTRVGEFVEKLKALSGALLSTDTPPGVISRAFLRSQHFSQKKFWPESPNEDYYFMLQMRDLASVAMNLVISAELTDPAVKLAAVELYGFVKYRLVIYERHVKIPELADAHGLCIFAPAEGAKRFCEHYRTRVTLGKATLWDQVVQKFGNSPPGWDKRDNE